MGVLKRTHTVHRPGAPDEEKGERYWFFCDGCSTNHAYTTKLAKGDVGHVWEFDGNEESPTFSPSLMCNKDATPEDVARGMHRCHLYLRAGMVKYLDDCTHHLANQTVPVKPCSF